MDTPPLAFMSFGFTELLVIGTVALLVFGGELPDVMRNLGRAYAKFRQGLHDMTTPVREEFRRVRDDVPNLRDAVTGNEATPTEEPATPALPRAAPPAPSDVWDDLDEPPPV